MRFFLLYGCLILLILLSLSCSKKVFNPYDESFGCPEGFKGDCSSVQKAYEKSIAESEKFSPLVTVGKETVTTQRPVDTSAGIDRISDEAFIPQISDVKKYRVFIPGYIDNKNIFYGKRKIYYFIDKPKWVIGGAEAQ
ncbi:MAG: hypothetical protein PVI90_01540 [Desulfobacteraceae bacterium]|jgi:conjugal transfer pilus assembly protein TraV